MSISSELPTFAYVCNTGQTAYGVPFTFDDPSYVKATWLDTSTDPNTKYPLEYGVDYTVSALGVAPRLLTLVQDKSSGKLLIYRETPLERLTDYQPYDPIPMVALNRELDRMLRILQEKINGATFLVIPGSVPFLEGQDSDALLPTAGAVFRHFDKQRQQQNAQCYEPTRQGARCCPG